MKKYYVDGKEVYEHQFTILLALSLNKTLQASEDSIVIVTETVKRFLEDGHSQNYGIGGKVFAVKKEKEEPKIEVDPNYNPCIGCQYYNKPWLSINNPCAGCSAYQARWHLYSTISQPASVSFEVTGTTNPANYKGDYIIYDNFLGLNIDSKLNQNHYEPSPMEKLVDAALNRKK